MWSYYGAKTNIIDSYPVPKYDKIIEPFAGTARYALKYFEKEVLLVDKYKVITDIWQWLQKCSPNDILKLPIPGPDQTTDDLTYDCIEAKWLVGFVIHFGALCPGKKVTPHYRNKRPNGINYSLNRIANNLFKIKHWTIIHGSFEEIKNETATWFIDPPYQNGGHKYIVNNKDLNYKFLAEWSEKRIGQIIICETIKADWMEFKPMKNQTTKNGKQIEAIWSNMPTAFDNEQIRMFNK